MIVLASTFSFAAVFFLVLCCASLLGWTRHPIDERILSLYRRNQQASESSGLIRNYRNRFVAYLGERAAPSDPEKQTEAKRRLAGAGYYSPTAVNTYWGLKIVLTTVAPMGVIGLYALRGRPLIHALFPSMTLLLLGLFAVDIYLHFIARSRRDQIFRALPDMLDLLVVCVESGLGLDAALQRVSEEFHLSNPVLSQELRMTCTAVRLGQSKNEALRELAERTGVMDLKTLVAVLIQADRFGTSIAQALRVHAEDMRTRRRQKAEELAAKTTVKLIFPLVMFIFPSIFVVLGGPAILKIMKIFLHKTV